jgi:glutamate-1-semialdehyde 2,1-aminomutase
MRNHDLFTLAQTLIPGGVNSPVRSFNAVGGEPFFVKKATGCYLYDVEQTQYLDYMCSWGANIVGHANPYVIEQVTSALTNGFSYGTPTELEVEFAQLITELLPSIEKFRLVSSGTEAVMTAIRLARGYTNRKYIIKFDGCYHGHSDNLLVKAGSGVATLNLPSCSGVPDELVKYTLIYEYNDIDALQSTFKTYGEDIAAVVIEPFAGNMNLVRPTSEFISTLRNLCTQHNSVLVFDEVITGFRVGLGGAQQILGITPDLTILGKVIGGGMPLAGFGGKKEIMDYLAPIGPVYQAGTLSGNPIAVTAGLAVLKLIQEPGFYTKLEKLTQELTSGLISIATKHGISFNADYLGGMFGIYFSESIPTSYTDAKLANSALFKQFFHGMLNERVFFAPSMFEAGFVCSVHSSEHIAQTLAIADKVFANLKV